MSTEWMGRYRDIVGALVRHTNIIYRKSSEGITAQDGLSFTAQEWQVFEYIIEHKQDDDRMMLISDRLGIPQSSFSKIATKLYNSKLVDKYQMVDNKKNIILKPTDYGEEVYSRQVSTGTNPFFEPFFEKLNDVDDETLKKFADALNALNDNLTK